MNFKKRFFEILKKNKYTEDDEIEKRIKFEKKLKTNNKCEETLLTKNLPYPRIQINMIKNENHFYFVKGFAYKINTIGINYFFEYVFIYISYFKTYSVNKFDDSDIEEIINHLNTFQLLDDTKRESLIFNLPIYLIYEKEELAKEIKLQN